MGTCSRFNQRGKNYQSSKIKLKPGQPLSVHVKLLLRKAKKLYISNLEPKLITDYKKFWKPVKPIFSDKMTVKEIINLTENGEILISDTDIADTFNDYFSNVVQNLNIQRETPC